MDVRSTLGEPFLASIPVADTVGAATEGSGAAMSVSLAPPKVYQRYGADPELVPDGLRVSFSETTNSVQISTIRALNEPAFRLVIEVKISSPESEQTRYFEYGVLLDFRAPSVALSKPSTVSIATAKLGAVSRVVPPPPAPRPSQSASAVIEPGSRVWGTTQPNDTLFGIAKSVRREWFANRGGLSTTQVAMALFDANPRAFRAGNINQLRVGADIRVPGAGVFDALSRAIASARFSEQMQRWRNPETGSRAVVSNERSTTATTESAGAVDGSSNGEARIPAETASVAVPNPRQPEVSVADVAPSVRASTLVEAIALERDASESVAASNEVLRDRLRSLDDQIASLKATLAQNAAVLESLRSPVSGTEAPGAPALDTAASASPASRVPVAPQGATPASPVPDTEPVGSSAAPMGGAENPVAKQTPLAPTPKSPMAATTVGQGQSWYTNPIFMFGLLGVFLGLGAAAYLLRGFAWRMVSKRHETKTAEIDASLRDVVSEKAAKALDIEEAGATLLDGRRVERDSKPEYAESEGVVGSAVAFQAEEAREDEAQVLFEQHSALFREVDVYVAYGRFDDAKKLVDRALENSPEDMALGLKLAEVLAEAGQRAELMVLATELAERISAAGNTTAWDHLSTIGRECCPDEPLFQQSLSYLRTAAGNPAVEDDDSARHIDELAVRRSLRQAN
jgi:pilus assembly protein FimV